MPLAKLVKRYLSLFTNNQKKSPTTQKDAGPRQANKKLLKFNLNHRTNVGLVINTINPKAKQFKKI